MINILNFRSKFNLDEREYKIYLRVYIIIAVMIFILGALTASPSEEAIPINRMSFIDIGYIFIVNLFVSFNWLFLSFMGCSVIHVFLFFFHLGKVGIESGINPLIYYISSLSHGIGEVIVGFIIFTFTIKYLSILIKCLRNKSIYNLKQFCKKTVVFTIKKISIILFISSCLEVLVSNYLINLLYKMII